MEIAACSFPPLSPFLLLLWGLLSMRKTVPTSSHRMGEVYGNNLYVNFPLHPKPGKSFLSQASHLDLASLDDLWEAQAVSTAHWQHFTAVVLTENLEIQGPPRSAFTLTGVCLQQSASISGCGSQSGWPRILRLAAFAAMGSGWLKLEGQKKPQ